MVTHNQWGISTAAGTQQGCKTIADRGKAFGMQTRTIDGNDPIVSYLELQKAMSYVRKERKPFLLEANVSRLYGHSSASGANLVTAEQDSIVEFEKKLEAHGVLTRAEMDQVRTRWSEEIAAKAREVRDEPLPDGSTIWEHVYAEDR